MTIRTFARIALAAAVGAAAGCGSPAMEKVETTAPVAVTVEAAKIDTLTGVVEVSGTVTPAPGADWTITAPGPARIMDLPKAENDAVRAGDVLVRFDMPNVVADVKNREAEAGQATARLTTAKAQLARQTGLQSQGVAALREVEAARQEVADAEAAVAQAQSAVTASKELSDRSVVRAKFDGVVAKRWHNPGELVDASSTDPILRVVDPRKLQVLASVPQAQLGRIVVGHAATVVGPGGGDGEPATVLTKPAQVDPTSATADVRLALTGATALPVGTLVQVKIVSEVKPNVLVVPTAGIVYEEGEIFVMVAGADNKAHKYPVVLGFATHDMTEIKSGIKAGDLVIVRGQDGLPDGGDIKVQK